MTDKAGHNQSWLYIFIAISQTELFKWTLPVLVGNINVIDGHKHLVAIINTPFLKYVAINTSGRQST